MSYKYEQISENEYLPLNQDDFILFFGNKHLYIFIRFFYILYERLYKAFEISEQFEDNSKTSRMTMEEK